MLPTYTYASHSARICVRAFSAAVRIWEEATDTRKIFARSVTAIRAAVADAKPRLWSFSFRACAVPDEDYEARHRTRRARRARKKIFHIEGCASPHNARGRRALSLVHRIYSG